VEGVGAIANRVTEVLSIDRRERCDTVHKWERKVDGKARERIVALQGNLEEDHRSCWWIIMCLKWWYL
jgi:Mn-dependent DtxR family transcriptional regulator